MAETTTSLYDEDYYTWAVGQADAARRRSANEIDWDHVAEELESLGASEERELYSRYVILLQHLLKWIAQPEGRSRSWRNTIAEQRLALARHLRRNPGLKRIEAAEFVDAYAAARLRASTETGLDLDAFPETPPFSAAEAKDEGWWPSDEA